jgi:SNF family Na+-dependent transporter
MSLGTGIVLFVIGAILAFALNVQVDWVDLHLVGYILMIAGAVGIIIGIVLLTRRRSSVATTRTAVDPATGERVTRRSRESDDIV